MKEVTVQIPEQKLIFFLELVRELGFEIASEIQEVVVDLRAIYTSINEEKAKTALAAFEVK